eukprot:COSAG05_NODE_7194_length_844_cov_0.931544_2_plen_111_part_00
MQSIVRALLVELVLRAEAWGGVCLGRRQQHQGKRSTAAGCEPLSAPLEDSKEAAAARVAGLNAAAAEAKIIARHRQLGQMRAFVEQIQHQGGTQGHDREEGKDMDDGEWD